VNWKQVIVDRPFNKVVPVVGSDSSLRMSSLIDWKKLIEDYNKIFNNFDAHDDYTAPQEFIAYFRHGSQDSRDLDVLYQFEKMPNKETILNFERGSGNEDRNIFTVDSVSGVVTACHRGIPDEVNNALLATYGLHEQVQKPNLFNRWNFFFESFKVIIIHFALQCAFYYRS